ncbi:MAG: DUF6695 family protein [Flavobacteriales bacterium]
MKTDHNGIAIALAWPETLCKQAGAWYDPIMRITGFSKNYYYKIGHAAVVLIENSSGNCFYFDFGRYHAPFGHGRVRDAETDHDLAIQTKAKISNNRKIENYTELLIELQNNPSCHGSGPLHASYCNINFESAYQRAKQLQENSPHKYGPFVWNGTNCSRFVRTTILGGKSTRFHHLRIKIPLTISPSPIGNVKSLKEYTIQPIISTTNE